MVETLSAFAAIGGAWVVLAWGAIRFARRAGRAAVRRGGAAAGVICTLTAAPFLAFAGYMGTFLALGQPVPEVRRIGEGAEYRREVFSGPRPIVVHTLEVDLSAGARIVVPGPAVGTRSAAVTATSALDRLGADAAINASFFHPFRESHPLSFYPREGDLVQAVGEAAGGGERYGQPQPGTIAFWSTPDRGVGFGDPPATVDAAVAGTTWLVREGRDVVADTEEPYPRTVVGLNAARDRLWLVVVDGKQPRYSMGMTLRELSQHLIRIGVTDAIQLDGGGSSTMAARNEAGDAALLNRPCHTKVPGRQRPVANLLGVVFPRS